MRETARQFLARRRLERGDKAIPWLSVEVFGLRLGTIRHRFAAGASPSPVASTAPAGHSPPAGADP